MLHLKDFCAQICQRVNRVRLQNFLNALKQEIDVRRMHDCVINSIKPKYQTFSIDKLPNLFK